MKQAPSTEQSAGDPLRFSNELAHYLNAMERECVTLTDLLQFMGRRSIAALLLFLALPMALPVPAPGISILFGLPLIVVSAQLMIGRRRVWLPARWGKRPLSRASLALMMQRVAPVLHRLERVVRPRVDWLANEVTMIPVGAICLILAVIIVLPVPLGHMLPGLAISTLALGMLERDGLVIGIGLATAAVALAVVALAMHGVVTWLYGYLSGL